MCRAVPRRDGKIHKVPVAPKEAMSSPLMSTMEKTRAVQFFSWVNDYNPKDPKTYSYDRPVPSCAHTAPIQRPDSVRRRERGEALRRSLGIALFRFDSHHSRLLIRAGTFRKTVLDLPKMSGADFFKYAAALCCPRAGAGPQCSSTYSQVLGLGGHDDRVRGPRSGAVP